MTNQKKTDYICISKESEGPAPDTLDETLPQKMYKQSYLLHPELEEPQKDNAEENEDEEGPDGKKKKGGKKGPGGTDILAMIKRLNEEAEAKAEEVEFWYGIIQTFFNFLKEDGSFVAMITDEGNRFDRAEIQREYAALTRKFKRQHGSDHELLVKFINENTEYLFDAFIEYLDNPEAWSQTIEFDDTPEDQEPELFAAHGIPQARKAGKSMSGKAGSGYMKALSIKQPWASLIIKGLKDVENRTWQVTDLPATVLIPTGYKFKVASDDQIEYEGRIYKLSPFVGTFMPVEKRNTSGAYQGAKYFTFRGEVLDDIRSRIESQPE